MPAAHTSPFKLKRKFDTLAVKLPANTITALTHNTKKLKHMSLNYAQSAKNYTRNCGALNQVKPTQKTTRTVCNHPQTNQLKKCQ